MLFKQVSSAHSKVNFSNELKPSEELNMYVFKNYYNGGGIAVGDINNDGLQDLYFTGNEVNNKLYLNKGNFQFEDITERAGVGCENVWSNGASFVDINQDGFLDLYVCKGGPPEVEGIRHNELFINQGDNTFVEQSKAYALDFVGLGVHAVFFDYDKDGDLDCYLLNNSIRSVGVYDFIKDQREIPSKNGNKLLKNTEGVFEDVTANAGIYHSEIGFGLGVTVGDVNQDGWEDLYVSNDYFEKDYLYINQKDGSFSEELENYFSEISLSSMGADFADLNNDAKPDLFVTDMLPQKLERYRTSTNFMNWKRYNLLQKQGYHNQFVRNSLQLNNEGLYFQEISRFAGVAATDWSWGALIFDMNNDGHKDIFVANGIGKDLTDQDYVNFYADRDLVQRRMKKNGTSLIKTLMQAMPEEKLRNYAFINDGKSIPRFKNQAVELGLSQKTFSNGSVYADLDNDGDLDLVVNNVNDVAGIYENQTTGNYYVKLSLEQDNGQIAYGAKAFVYADTIVQYQEVAPFRGFQSCVDPRLNFGLGTNPSIDSIVVQWPNGKHSSFRNPKSDSTYILSQPETDQLEGLLKKRTSMFTTLSYDNLPAHFENTSPAFDDELLLLRTRSREGPRISSFDANSDDRLDVYLPGAKGIPGKFLIQRADGGFDQQFNPTFRLSSFGEEVNTHSFDANGDGLEDLYVCYGGDEFSPKSNLYKDILFLRAKDGSWTRSESLLPSFATSVAISNDIDNDGDLDLFVAPRLIPGSFGQTIEPEIWENDGSGMFRLSEEWTNSINYSGFITDAAFKDIDGDNVADLIVVGEWGSPVIFSNSNGQFKVKQNLELPGFWNRLYIQDVDRDGDLDVLLGNLGSNSFLSGSENAPLRLYVNDFDENGEIEQFLTYHKDGEDYTYTLRDELVSALPVMKKKYLKFSDYKSASIKDMFGAISPSFEVTETRSGWLENVDGEFVFRAFPDAAQLFPVFAITTLPEQGNRVVLAGNYGECKPQIGAYLAGKGVVLEIDENGISNVLGNTGLRFDEEVRDFSWYKQDDYWNLMVVNNNAAIEIFRYNE